MAQLRASSRYLVLTAVLATGCNVPLQQPPATDGGQTDSVTDGAEMLADATQDAHVANDAGAPDPQPDPDLGPLDATRPTDVAVQGPCVGQPDGALVDECGVCDDNSENDCTQDCAGMWGGAATRDNCDVCDDDAANDNTTCTQDCAGMWGGAATRDNCDVCDDNPANDNTTCALDCAGVWGGAATRDNCDVCDDDAANDNTACIQDCAGVWGGAATRDNCDVCDDDANNDCLQDCTGQWGGRAVLDNCDVCDDNPANDCIQDCADEWGGMAVLDDCDVCDDDRDNDNSTCEVEPLRIYLAPDGDDGNDGQSPQTAILTLLRANALLEARQPRRPVTVVIGLGTYFGQRVNWRYIMPNHGVEFTRPDGAETRPVFDGCRDGECPGGTWFQISSSTGQPTRLTFNYLQIQHYGTAMSFNGNRNAEDASNGGNRVFGCYLSRIGNIFNANLNPSTAAIRLVNSDDNIIENTHFVDIINTRSAGLIHGVYVAHMSDRNTIERNRFLRNSGDPVRLRDFSNDNVINGNRFIRSGIEAGYTDWYCDHEARDDCTKPAPECPSWNNQFRNNQLDGNFRCDQLGTFHYFQDAETAGCAPPTPDARRLRTSGNESLAPPCQGD